MKEPNKDIVYAILVLKDFCEDMGVTLEFIKTSGKTGFTSIHGVEFKDTIYEHDATNWVRKEQA